MNTQYIKYMLLPAVMFSTVAFAQEEEQSEQINVAFRKVAAEDVLTGVSSINYEELAAKNNNTYSLDNIQAYTGGFNGTSLWGMSEYLVLVDGVPRAANNVKPDEIAQITFLKGANAVILYGSRAANGAILITTKRGKQGDIQIDVHANTGWNTAKALPKYLGSAEYMAIYNTVDPGKYSQQQMYDAYAGTDPFITPNNDLYSSDYIKKAYNRWEVVAEIKGGGERARYYSNIGYYRNGSYMNFGNAASSYNDRLNVRGNVDMNLADWITAYVDANVSFYGARGAQGADFWEAAATMRPNRAAFFLDPSMVSPYASSALDVVKDAQLVNGMLLNGDETLTSNAIADGYRSGKNNYYSRNFQFTAGVNLDLERALKGLSFKTMVGVDYATEYNIYFNDTYAVYKAEWSEFNGKKEITGLTKIGKDEHTGVQNVGNSSYTQTIAFNAHLDYDRSFGDHNVNAMALVNGYQQTLSGQYHGITNANLGLSADYNYAHKYYLQLAGAVVQSAKLAEGHRQGLDYSATAGWNLAKESFMEGGLFNDLTLSASYSLINQDIDIRYRMPGDSYVRQYYIYAGTFDQAQGAWWDWGGSDGRESTQSKRGSNPDLDFIKRKSWSVSLRGALLENSLKFNASYYVNNIEGKLFMPTTIFPSYFNSSYPAASFNSVVNFNNDKHFGFEVGVSYDKKFGEVELGIGANLSWFDTEMTKRDDSAYADSYQYRQGKRIDTMWGYEALGFFKDEAEIASAPDQSSFGEAPRPGDLKYKDQNGDGVIDTKDQVDLGRSGGFYDSNLQQYFGYGNPLSLGINLTAKYKNFTLFVLGVGGFGAKAQKDNSYYRFSGDDKYSIIARDCWTPETANTALYPRLTKGSGANNFQTSDFWMYKTDRFDIAKIQLTYECPSSWFANQRVVRGVSAFVNAANVFTFAPEKEILELNVGSEPQSRFFQAGVTVNF